MIQLRGVLIATPLCLGLVATGDAATVSFTQLITSTGQNFSFSLPAPDSDGGPGKLYITLNGDFSRAAVFDSGELADIDLDDSTGLLSVRNESADSGDGIRFNFVPGLSLQFSSATESSFHDVELRYEFAVSSSLLDVILADSQFAATIDLSQPVEASAESDADYVTMVLEYNDAAVIPLPATLPLVAGGLLMLAMAGIGRARPQA